MSAFVDHPLRRPLTAEIHARPFAALSAPERVSHIAMLSGESGRVADRAALDELCRRFGVAAPDPGVSQFMGNFGAFRLIWERHAEFCSWTFLVAGDSGDPFAEPALAQIPRDWLESLPGERLVGIHVALLPRDRPSPTLDELGRYFAADSTTASRVSGGAAVAWTDFQIGRAHV